MITILPEFEQQYQNHIDLGTQFLFDKKICVLGLARNVGHIIYDNILSISNLRQHCNSLHYFIYENDSADDTAEKLKYCQNNIANFYFRSERLSLKSFDHSNIESKKELKSTERTQNLAKHRNICLSYVKENLSDSDFVIVMDIDFEKFSLNGILNSFGWLSKNWCDGIVGSSLENKHLFNPHNKNLWNYDCWAYRGTWWEDLQKYSNSYGYDPMLWFGFWQLPIGSEPISVNSAFGGIGIYKTKQYISVEYDGYDCEHVCLHKNLKIKYPNYKLCINPSQLMLFS